MGHLDRPLGYHYLFPSSSLPSATPISRPSPRLPSSIDLPLPVCRRPSISLPPSSIDTADFCRSIPPSHHLSISLPPSSIASPSQSKRSPTLIVSVMGSRSSLVSVVVRRSSAVSVVGRRSSLSFIEGTQTVSSDRPLRQFVSGKGKSAGRNSAGRITIFHRGGGAKRSQRTVDLKRNTSSVGVVERIEYDPNRTSRIAVVRWVEGAEVSRQRKVNAVEEPAPPHKTLPTMTVTDPFSFSSLPGMLENRKVVHSLSKADHVVVGLPNGMVPGSKSPFTTKTTAIGSKMTSVRDVFLSAFTSSKMKGDDAPYSFVSSLGLPRMAIAGAKPDYFVPRMKDDVKGNESLSLNEIRKWDKDSIVWAHKMERKAAVSWQSFRQQEMLGLGGVAEHNKSKLKPKAMNKEKSDEKFTVDSAPVTYILATHQMKVGKMVMNCDSSKRSQNELLHRY